MILYGSFLIKVDEDRSPNQQGFIVYQAIGFNPGSGEVLAAAGDTDTEALHKLRGCIDLKYGKPRLSGN